MHQSILFSRNMTKKVKATSEGGFRVKEYTILREERRKQLPCRIKSSRLEFFQLKSAL